jgi:hypothetical protein
MQPTNKINFDEYTNLITNNFKIEYPDYITPNKLISVKEAYLETDLISLNSYVDIIQDKINIYLNNYLFDNVESLEYMLPSDSYSALCSDNIEKYYLDIILESCSDDISDSGLLTLRDGEEISVKDMIERLSDLAASSFSTTIEHTLNLDVDELSENSSITDIELILSENSEAVLEQLNEFKTDDSEVLLGDIISSSLKSGVNIVSMVAAPLASHAFFGENIEGDVDFLASVEKANSVIENMNLFSGIIPDSLIHPLTNLNLKIGVDQPKPLSFTSI